MAEIKIIVFGDSHIGFDYTAKPKIERPRRGSDFINNFIKVIDLAIKNKADLILHLGDVFNRSKPPAVLVDMVFENFIRACDAGIPVVIVPGNHERSFLSLSLFAFHEKLKIFTKPEVFKFNPGGLKLAIAGFPFVRGDIRNEFITMCSNLEVDDNSDFNMLLFHQAVDGARVGIQNYTFRNREDVINIADISCKYHLVMSGHIHRKQTLISPDGVEIIYPGSIERTSFVEREEPKGFYELTVRKSTEIVCDTNFLELPTRKMYYVKVNKGNIDRIIDRLDKIPNHSVLQLHFSEQLDNTYYNRIKIIEKDMLWIKDILIEYSFGARENQQKSISP